MNENLPSYNQEITQPVRREPSLPPTPEINYNQDTQVTRISNSRAPLERTPISKGKKRKNGCCIFGILIPVLLVILLYFFFPSRSNILLLGIDRAPEGTDVSRSDTIIVTSIIPLQPTVNMLSIPRDLWVVIPNVGENRINTAHFFAEAEEQGSGPLAAMEAVQQNFGITINYYARIRFDGVKEIIDAMDGITITLDQAMSGYEAGTHHLNGEQALAFARDRQGTDDFFRMERGQILITSAIKELIQPASWGKIPRIIRVTGQVIDTNIPFVLYPRLGLAVLRATLSDQIDNRTITREMITPFTTDQGASVLLPNWDLINPVLLDWSYSTNKTRLTF